MEHSIGVGAIVGLTFASSIYVWNNGRFSITQKTLLLICIIFPPAQWLGILIVSIYNSNVENNTSERKTEKKLDSTISNLTELKEKGILTEEEYKTKVDKIETEKTEQNLKNSLEYRQLKSLFDNGILTKEEFENKIQLLQSVSEKEVDTKEISKLIDSVNKTYIDSTEDKVGEKNTNFTALYVIIAVCILLIGGIILYSNSEPNNLEDTYVQPAIDTTVVSNTNSYNSNYQEPSINKKYVYVIIKIKKPKLEVYQLMSYTNTLGYEVTPEPTYSISFENETYTTEIIEIENYNIDEKYKAMDGAKNKMYSKLAIDDSVFSSNLWVKCKDDAKREEFQKISSEIVDTQIYDFDSYSEASISKKKTLNEYN